MDKKRRTIIVVLICVLVAGVILFVGWLSYPKDGEMEIVVTRKYAWDKKNVAIEIFSGEIQVFNKEDAADIHAGGIYWIRFKGRRILEFEKIGDLSWRDVD